MFTVCETPLFTKAAGVWDADELESFVDWISENPVAGDVIQGAAGLRKVRWAMAGAGKRGGARVIYFTKNAKGEIWLIAVYSKAKRDTIPTKTLLQWKEAIDE